MNTPDPTIPPVIPEGKTPPAPPAEICLPINNLGALFDSLLRTPRRLVWHFQHHKSSSLIAQLAVTGLLAALAYGLVVGCFSMKEQLWIAPVKIAGGLLVSILICLPSLYIFAALNGARARLSHVLGLAAAFVALTMLLLIGFAPVAWIFSVSTESAAFMGALHLVFWVVCLAFGFRFLWTSLEVFEMKPGFGFRIWLLIFLLVTLQMTCALRPIVAGGRAFFPENKMFFLNYWVQCLNDASLHK